MFQDDICAIVIFVLIQAWWQNGEDCVTVTPSPTAGCELMPFFNVPLALIGSCFLCAASLLRLHLSQPTSLNLMYSDVGMFKRGMVHSDRENRTHRKWCPHCCPPAGKAHRPPGLEAREAGSRNSSSQRTSLALLPPHKSSLISQDSPTSSQQW